MRAGKDVSYLEGTRLGKLPKIPGPGTYIGMTAFENAGRPGNSTKSSLTEDDLSYAYREFFGGSQ